MKRKSGETMKKKKKKHVDGEQTKERKKVLKTVGRNKDREEDIFRVDERKKEKMK